MGLFSAIGGLIGLGSSNKAHDRYNEGLGTAGGMLQQGLTDTEARLKPLADYAPDVLSRLNNTIMNGDMTGFYNSPDYQYNLDQTTRGLNAKAAQQGTLMSGNTLKELQKNASGLASQNYGSYINNLNNIFAQSNPYYQAYSEIPNLKGQANANIQLGQTANMARAAADKGNILSGIFNGLSSIGGLSSLFGGSSGFNPSNISLAPSVAQPWSSSGGIPQFGSSYGFGGF